jgi:hypothetical protein
MGAGSITRKSGAWRRILLGAFVLYVYGLLGYLGVAHKHVSEASHDDCQLCHISAQPSLTHDIEPAPVARVLPFVFVSGPEAAALAPRLQPFFSRGPPSV